MMNQEDQIDLIVDEIIEANEKSIAAGIGPLNMLEVEAIVRNWCVNEVEFEVLHERTLAYIQDPANHL